MTDNESTAIDLSQPVDFSYPEGLAEAASVLDFLPEEARIGLVVAAAFDMLGLIG